MIVESTKAFTTGQYAYAHWTCSDAISRLTIYKVIKRTPKRVTLAATYPNGQEDKPVILTIDNPNALECAWDKERFYAKVYPAKEAK